MQAVQGYDFSGNMPYICMPTMPQIPPEVIQFNLSCDVKAKSQDEARALLLAWINQTCCYGSKPAKECEIKTCVGKPSFVCNVDTFVEYRSTEKAFRPYVRGTPYTSPRDGYPPQPWAIPCSVIPHFQDKVEKIEVPFTSSIVECHDCQGQGQVRCSSCSGDGKVRCTRCGGDGKVTHHGENGHTHQDKCNACGGDGQCKCTHCGGDGRLTCNTCSGNKQLRWFIEMTRTHKTLKNMKAVDDIPDRDLSPAEVNMVKGKPILERTAPNMAPPSGFNPEIDQTMMELDNAAQQQRASLNSYQHQERITLSMVPVTQVTAQYDGAQFRWYIYGECNAVKVVDYPATMCCGCDLM